MSETGNRVSRTVPALLTLSGLLAAFGVASCCAIPLFLATLGVGSAWLAGIGLYAAFHRPVFLAAAAIGLLGGGAVLIWQRRRISPLNAGLTSICLLLGLVLLYCGYTYA
jgi:mercuric ion transport protein